MSRPSLAGLDLWTSHERRVLQVLSEALSLLQGEAGLVRREVMLNRTLYSCMLVVNERLWRAGTGGLDGLPVPDGRNPPSPDDERRAKRENKIPDFYWAFMDHSAEDARRGAHYFVIECKRLGTPARADWILNENYVEHGVLRFVRPEHGYAKGELSAAMVGYIESMTHEDILAEVNAAALKATLAMIERPRTGWQIGGISHLEHQLIRLTPEPVLRLTHLWVDLRSSFDPSSTRPCLR